MDVGKPNLYSAALRVRFGESSAILGGDVGDKEWERISRDWTTHRRPDELRAGVVLVPHHGGSGNDMRFWEVVSRRSPPTYAIISCGSGDKSHPSRETLETLKAVNATVRCTAPNWHCCAEHAERGRQPPCAIEQSSYGPQVSQCLPPRIRRVGSGARAAIAPSLRSVPDLERSVCMDVFESGEEVCRVHARGLCKHATEDVQD